MKKTLSWKLLIPLGIVLWVLGGNAPIGDILGGFIALLGVILFVLGIVDGSKRLLSKKQSAASHSKEAKRF